MLEFSNEHSSAWLELMESYQIFREKLFDWAHESDQIKRQDLLLEFDGWENRDIFRRLLVTDFLRSTEMWDKKAILLVWKELTAVALYEQEEIAAYARLALAKIKSCPERFDITDEIFRLAEAEEKQEKPDLDMFHNGCCLLYDLECEERFAYFASRYGVLIEQAYGLDEKDLADMHKALLQKEKEHEECAGT